MVIYLNEYLRERNERRQAHRVTHAHALRVTSKRAVAALSAYAGANSEPILPAAAFMPAANQTYLAPIYAGASILDDVGAECGVPDNPTERSGDAVWMNSLYEQASLL